MGSPKIILKSNIPGEEGIRLIEKQAKNEGLISTVIRYDWHGKTRKKKIKINIKSFYLIYIFYVLRDAGRTEVTKGTVTVIGIGPGFVDKISKVTSHLKTL